ncbi:cation diffusion facilitator family transporter [Frigoribacterium sp. Leaf172]|uniref:cation diffusion facilitator family transporter n=1 Tax=Frigoribacterium sp. Leaf172 TaxID=1736285 RepID=UPI0006FCEEF3|nr:cation diffusion facilitator family transporter [Frigoribacterium sp. Leaf172]KQR66382.1 cobalt transporter [Frigoribacterium sp. Leaf172]
MRDATRTAKFGHPQLPDEQRDALRRAVRLEWVTIGVLTVTATLMFLVLGSSQAMRVAWIEDLLSFLPPIAFLMATRVIRRPPTRDHPYGLHRATGIAHLVAAVALLVMGAYLIVDSGFKLVIAEHPTIGGIEVLGRTVWLGWLMVATLAVTSVAPVILGRAKLTLSETLHDKVLYADADMNKADWMTGAAAIAGIVGIGVGWWWADSVAALLISVSILHDGLRNLRGAVAGLMDRRARTYDDEAPHPLTDRIDEHLTALPWVEEARSRVRELGHVFHVESFVVPREGMTPSLEDLEAARSECVDMDWKVQDMVIVPTAGLPSGFLPGLSTSGQDH